MIEPASPLPRPPGDHDDDPAVELLALLLLRAYLRQAANGADAPDTDGRASDGDTSKRHAMAGPMS
jgi:hypothetical protein